MPVPPRPDASGIRPIVSRALGIARNGEPLREAVAALLPIATAGEAASDPALVALMMAVAALRREESRGSHYRSDFVEREPRSASSRSTIEDAFEAAATFAEIGKPLARRARK
jgi:L-aspartate oxidase